jgi:hypothetical protein
MKTNPTVTVTLDLADALGVGHSLRSLAAHDLPNASTAAVFARVGEQIVSAAQAELVGATIPAATATEQA